MTVNVHIDGIQTVTFPAVFSSMADSTDAWARHNAITSSDLLGYAIVQTHHIIGPCVGTIYSPDQYGRAIQHRNDQMRRNDGSTYRVVAVYDYDGTPTIVL